MSQQITCIYIYTDIATIYQALSILQPNYIINAIASETKISLPFPILVGKLCCVLKPRQISHDVVIEPTIWLASKRSTHRNGWSSNAMLGMAVVMIYSYTLPTGFLACHSSSPNSHNLFITLPAHKLQHQ